MRIECPVRSCDGEVITRRVGEFGNVLLCTGEDAHGDATIRNYVENFHEADEDNDAEMDEILLRCDPVEYMRDQVGYALERKGGGIRKPNASMLLPPPTYPTGLRGVQNGTLLYYQGMTLLSGKASCGKTWSALRASLDAAVQGWEVHYLAAEGVAVAHGRAAELTHNDVPKRWRLQVVEDGSTLDDIGSYLRKAICSERTLVVIDSFSTMLRMLDDESGDPWELQRRLERFLFNLRQGTAGCIAPLVISEANAAGETKGRSFDHIADLSVNFRADEDEHAIKHIRVHKSWWAKTGEVGRFKVSPGQGGLVRLPDEDASLQEQREYSHAFGGDD